MDSVKPSLSPREKTVSDLIGRGLSNKEISMELGVTEKTVKFHITNIFAKNGVKSRAQLMAQRHKESVSIREMDLFKNLMK